MNATCLDATALETCVSAAVAAPTIRNMQPWRFRLEPETVTFQVRAAPGGGTTDLNQHLCAGACVLNLRLAMAHFGWSPVTRLLPDPEDPGLLATVRPTEQAPGTFPSGQAELYEAIWRRHSTRLPFSPAPLPDDLLAELSAAARTEGARLDFAGPAETERLLRLAAQAEHRDHVLAEGPRGARPARPAHDRRTSGPVALLTSDHDRPGDWLRAGQALEQVLLRATAHGLRTSLLYRATEWPDLRGALPTGPGHAHMLLRIGYGVEGPGRPVGAAPGTVPERT